MKRSSDERLAELYATHAPRARRLAYLLTGDTDEAEDLLQEAFVRLGARFLKLRDPDRAAGYVYRTVANLARDHGRRLRRDQEVRKRLSNDVSAEAHDVAETDELWSALTELSIRHRTVLFLRYYMDLSEAQTAELLNCSISAVKSLNHRATLSLRKRLRGDKP